MGTLDSRTKTNIDISEQTVIINPNSMLPVGTLLQNGKYRIELYLSSGGFGNTYVAINTEFEEEVAIKEFFIRGVSERDCDTIGVSVSNKENIGQFNSQKEKFKKEARRLRRLRNEHIVGVHDLFEENGTAYYVMDLIKGETLSEKLKRLGHPLSEEDVLKILDQVLDALSVVHSEGLYHLDLKPANIMIDETGRTLLIDFGASKQISVGDSLSVSTSSTLAFTPGFAPLEQTEQNIKSFGPWTDLYALGATLYKLLTGLTPPSASEILMSTTSLTFPTSVSTKMQQLIVWMMKPRIDERPQSVNKIIMFLSTGRKLKTIEEKKDIHNMKSSRKLWRGVVIGVIAVIIISIAMLFLSVKLQQSIEPETSDYSIDVTVHTEPRANEVIMVNGTSFKMIGVQGGTFTMGATPEQGSSVSNDEKPTHEVTLSSFSIGETEVTQEQWQAIMGTTPSLNKGSKLPVENVSWEDCQNFIRKLNSMTGRQFRLPTEAEWEYAARGGRESQNYMYSGSNSIDDVGWWGDNSGWKTHDVATKRANELGIYDMSGNVSEWVQDWHGSYSSGGQTNPTGVPSGEFRVNRGGCINIFIGPCTVSLRNYSSPTGRSEFLGLRLAL